MSRRLILLMALSSLLLLLTIFTAETLTKTPATPTDDDGDEDLSFLEEEEDDSNDTESQHSSQHNFDDDDDDYFNSDDDDEESFDDFDVPSDLDHEDEEAALHPKVDEKDVVVLTERNFSVFIESNKYVMVEFYAPWCGHCKAMAPEYAAAATELKALEFEKVVLAKVDAIKESKLAEKYEVQGFPTVYFFVDGKHKSYPAQRSKDAIVTWIKKKVGPGVANITTLEDAERVLTSEDKLVLAFLNSLMGPESDELAAASKIHDDVNFYQTINPEVAKLFHLEPNGKRPSLVLLKKEAEKVTAFDGQFSMSEIAEFVSANKLPLVTTFTRESATMIFESPIKKQVLLFATSRNSEKIIHVFQEAAKHFKGKLVFVYVEMDDKDTGRPVAEYFGVEGDTTKVLGYTGVDDPKKYILDEGITIESIQRFGEDFLEDKLKPVYKSDLVPETNDGDVKIVVGNTFDDIVLDESKDVLLEIYAPWCGHCQAFEPTYNKLAKHLHGVPSIVIKRWMVQAMNILEQRLMDFQHFFSSQPAKRVLIRLLLKLTGRWWHCTSSLRNMLLSLLRSQNKNLANLKSLIIRNKLQARLLLIQRMSCEDCLFALQSHYHLKKPVQVHRELKMEGLVLFVGLVPL